MCETLVNIINNLYPRLRVGISSSELTQILRDLIEYAETHFRAEEAVMRECGYPDLSAQEHAHRHFTLEVQRLIIRIMDNLRLTLNIRKEGPDTF